MIFDSVGNAAVYRGVGARFAAALDFIALFDPSTPDGRISLEGDDLFALVQSYQTGAPDTKPFESHRIYADLQFVAVGEEIIYTAQLDRLQVTTPYSVNNDAALYTGPDDTPLRLRPGDFCVLWPQDGHKPCCQAHTSTKVKKVVVKVRL